MKVKLSFKEIEKYLNIESPEFPKYVAPLINLANQYAQGTRPKTVGQMSELIHQFAGKSLPEWEEWYLQQKPDAIKNAAEKIVKKLEELKNSLNKIDQGVVEEWVRDLVIVKTFIGLRVQEAILKKGAELKKTGYRLALPGEETEGIDGYIGDIPVSIKPHTYAAKAGLPESINAKLIFYKKIRGGIEVDYREII